jgi:hypothetical protein
LPAANAISGLDAYPPQVHLRGSDATPTRSNAAARYFALAPPAAASLRI